MRKNINWNCFAFFARFCLVFYNCLAIDEKEKEISIWVVSNITLIKRRREKGEMFGKQKRNEQNEKKHTIKRRNRQFEILKIIYKSNPGIL